MTDEAAALRVALHGYRMLADGSLSVTTIVEPRDVASFHRMCPENHVSLALARIFDSPKSSNDSQPAPGPSFAQKLHAQGYFRQWSLWTALDKWALWSEADHLGYIKSLPCFRPYPQIPCGGDVVAHHCRNADNAGTGFKPDDRYTIPVCHAHHDHIHRHATRDERAKQLEQAVTLAAGECKRIIKEAMSVESLRDVTPAMLAEFEETINFEGPLTAVKVAA